MASRLEELVARMRAEQQAAGTENLAYVPRSAVLVWADELESIAAAPPTLTAREREFFEAAREFAEWEERMDRRGEDEPLLYGEGMDRANKLRAAYRALDAGTDKETNNG